MCVEVFKTNVNCPEESGRLVKELLQYFPFHIINFDLEDCDKILRIEGKSISTSKLIAMMDDHGYFCEVLE